MATSSASAAIVQEFERKARGRTRWQSFLRFFRTKPLGGFGFTMVLVLVLMAIFAPWIATHDPYELRVNALFVPPAFAEGGREFLLGTDNYGRDLFSRIVWGSRISVYVAFTAVAVGSSIGALLGLTSAFVGGKFDIIVQRVIDAKYSIPALILALALMAALGSSVNNVIIAISINIIGSQCRVVRSTALGIKENMYIEAANAIGATGPRILFRHLLPNCFAPYLILVSAELGGAILTEASLSFLGLGVPPPNPSWGAMLSGAAQQYVERAPWMAIFPGLAISAVVFGFNIFGDALRDVLDPRLRRG